MTQNVDGLHQTAGSRRVLELHGSLARVRCTECGAEDGPARRRAAELPRCDACDGLLRPGVVWFHEMLPEGVWRDAAGAVTECNGFLVVGTSAVVYPAAGLIELARGLGACVIEVNLEPAAQRRRRDRPVRPAGEILPRLVRRLDSSAG